VVSALAQNYGQARIDEVRDIPVITIVEAPEAPALPDSRMLLLRGLLALVARALLGALLAFLMAFVRGQQDRHGRRARRVPPAQAGDRS
jgi:uncharacterized protein involved in exopolysaccharide biosynthesis